MLETLVPVKNIFKMPPDWGVTEGEAAGDEIVEVEVGLEGAGVVGLIVDAAD